MENIKCLLGKEKRPLFLECDISVNNEIMDHLLCGNDIHWRRDYHDRHLYLFISYLWKYKYGDYLVNTHPINKYRHIIDPIQSSIMDILVDLKSGKKMDKTLKWPNHWYFIYMRDGDDCLSKTEIPSDFQYKSPIIIICIGHEREIIFKNENSCKSYKLKNGHAYIMLSPIQKKYTFEIPKNQNSGKLSIILIGKYLRYNS